MSALRVVVLWTSFLIVYAGDVVFDIDELNAVYYNINLQKPILKTSEQDGEIMTVVNKFGQEYICNIPEFEILQVENKDDAQDDVVDIANLLKPMESGPCLIKKKNWWTYEFCYGMVVQQYHVEDNKVIGPIIYLGTYESDYNWNNDTESKNKLEKYHSQYYVNGTRCDITGEPRRTEVQFHCQEGSGDIIKQVDEPQSCKYVFIIATTRICHHPYLKPQSNRTPYSISCSPSLSEDQYEKYLRIEEIKDKEKKLERRNMHQSHVELDGKDENETEEEAKVSIRLLTIPISSKRNSKIDNGKDEQSQEARDDADADEMMQLLSNAAEETNLEFKASAGMNDDDMRDIVEEIKGGVQRTAKTQWLRRSQKEAIQDEQDTAESDKQHFVDANEDVGEGGVEALEEDESATAAPRVNEKVNRLIEKWQNVKKGFEGSEDREKVMKEMFSDFQKMFAENDFMQDVTQLADKYSKDFTESEGAESLEKTQLKMKEILSDLSRSLNDAKYIPEKGDEPKQSMQKVYEEMKELFADKPEFLKDVVKLSEKYSSHFIERKDGGKEPFDDALRDQEQLNRILKTLSSAVKATVEEKALKVKEKIETLEYYYALLLESLRRRKKRNVRDEVDFEEGNAEANKIRENSPEVASPQRFLNERTLDPSHKVRLEQKIKERLQKSGIDNVGPKIEVKILSPNPDDDDDDDSPVLLSNEESDAIHNVIYNVLQSTREELKEREQHSNFQDLYNFELDNNVLQEDLPGTDDDPEHAEDREDDHSMKNEYSIER